MNVIDSDYTWQANYNIAGYLRVGAILIEPTSICKKCTSPKSPQAHHCCSLEELYTLYGSSLDDLITVLDIILPDFVSYTWKCESRLTIGQRHLFHQSYKLQNSLDATPVKDESDLIQHPFKSNKREVLIPVKDIPIKIPSAILVNQFYPQQT
ncbi:unnamed protein product [Pieris brassicae]|uniref:Uncharacterized protein n=1 Tax=Pieris brassicae TaxID=7116 RepID=A0A9P0TWN2_PIEBR|nr:unnamed protein product [Pieris brassicae]